MVREGAMEGRTGARDETCGGDDADVMGGVIGTDLVVLVTKAAEDHEDGAVALIQPPNACQENTRCTAVRG